MKTIQTTPLSKAFRILMKVGIKTCNYRTYHKYSKTNILNKNGKQCHCHDDKDNLNVKYISHLLKLVLEVQPFLT